MRLPCLLLLALIAGCRGTNPAYLPAPPSLADAGIDAAPLDAASAPIDAAAADTAPELASDLTPDLAPDLTLDLASELTPDMAPDLAPETGGAPIIVDDRVVGTGLHQFNYVPNWPNCGQCLDGGRLYADSNSWSNVLDAQATVAFVGTRIHVYAVLHPTHGFAGISIVDEVPEQLVDFYAAQRAGNQLHWSSPVLSPGRHVLKVRVTRMQRPGSEDYFVALDRVVIE